jgi:DDE superfamily endonuclease
LGAILAPKARTVTAALRVMGFATEHHFTNDPRVLNRAPWSARQASRILLGLLISGVVPPGATMVLGADDPVDRRSGRKITAKGCSRDAVRSSTRHGTHCVGLKWVSMMLLVPVPWAQRGWALPVLSALCWPAEKSGRRRHKTRVDWVRQMMEQVRRWLPERRLVLVVEGGFAAVSLALACVKRHVAMVSRLRWDAALDHPPGPQPPGKRGRKPLKGQRQRRLQGWAERSDPPWETVEVDWYGAQRKQLWVVSRTALGSTPRLPPGAIRCVMVCASKGKRRMEAFFWTDLQAPPVDILQGVVMRWSVEVTFEEGRAHLGLEPQRQWSDRAIARTTPAVRALFSLVTLLALQLSQGGHLPVPVTAWYHNAEPTFVDCLALVRGHLWRARYMVNAVLEAEIMQFPREAFERLFPGFPLAA